VALSAPSLKSAKIAASGTTSVSDAYTPTAGSLAIVFASRDTSASESATIADTWGDTGGTAWASVDTADQNLGGSTRHQRAYWFYRLIGTGASSGTATVTWTGGTTGAIGAHFLEITGQHTTTPVVQNHTATATNGATTGLTNTMSAALASTSMLLMGTGVRNGASSVSDVVTDLTEVTQSVSGIGVLHLETAYDLTSPPTASTVSFSSLNATNRYALMLGVEIAVAPEAHSGSASVTATAALSGTATKAATTGTGSVAATAAVTESGTKQGKGTAAITSTAAVTESGAKQAAGTASVTASSSTAETGMKQERGDAPVAVSVAVAGSGTTNRQGSSSVDGSSAVAATGTRASSGTASITGTSALDTAGEKNANGDAAISGTGSVDVTGVGREPGKAVVDVFVALTVLGTKDVIGTADLDASTVLTATGATQRLVDAELAALVELLAEGSAAQPPPPVIIHGPVGSRISSRRLSDAAERRLSEASQRRLSNVR
jgi:hypothetical protein